MRLKIDESEEKQRIVKHVNQFVINAKAAGFTKQQWVEYPVNINEPVSFSEMGKILNQCSNSDTYYFRPDSLEIKTISSTDQTQEKNRNPQPKGTSTQEQKAEALVALKGTFVVKQEK